MEHLCRAQLPYRLIRRARIRSPGFMPCCEGGAPLTRLAVSQARAPCGLWSSSSPPPFFSYTLCTAAPHRRVRTRNSPFCFRFILLPFPFSTVETKMYSLLTCKFCCLCFEIAQFLTCFVAASITVMVICMRCFTWNILSYPHILLFFPLLLAVLLAVFRLCLDPLSAITSVINTAIQPIYRMPFRLPSYSYIPFTFTWRARL